MLNLLDAPNLESYDKLFSTIAHHIKLKAEPKGNLNIIEAGCGRRWAIDLADVRHTLTGVDKDKNALDKRRDLDIAILADLMNVPLKENYYDVIFSYNVLEHIDGVENVLENFITWLKPCGIMVLRFPNRDSVRGFLTRITPFWFHVFYKKYFEGYKNAGKPGYDPYPTVFNKVVSRKGMYKFCKKHNLNLKAEYRIDIDSQLKKNQLISFLAKAFLLVFQIISFKKLTVDYYGLLYIIEKPKLNDIL